MVGASQVLFGNVWRAASAEGKQTFGSDTTLRLRLKATLSVLPLLGFLLATPGQKDGPTPQPWKKLSVFGSDDRQEFEASERPWSAIGRIDLLPPGTEPEAYEGNVAFCTGSLVARDLVVTNAHCVLDPKTGSLTKQSIWFRPAYHLQPSRNSGLASQVVQVWLGSNQPDNLRSQDWALLRLEKPLGDQVGWFNTEPVASYASGEFKPRATTFVGYAMDFKNGHAPVTHIGCQLAAWEPREPYLHHDCDMNAGSSGGPLLVYNAAGKPVIIAINAAHMSPDKVSYVEQFSARDANIAVPSNHFATTLDLLTKDRPLAAFQPFYEVDMNRQPRSLWPASYPTARRN